MSALPHCKDHLPAHAWATFQHAGSWSILQAAQLPGTLLKAHQVQWRALRCSDDKWLCTFVQQARCSRLCQSVAVEHTDHSSTATSANFAAKPSPGPRFRCFGIKQKSFSFSLSTFSMQCCSKSTRPALLLTSSNLICLCARANTSSSAQVCISRLNLTYASWSLVCSCLLHLRKRRDSREQDSAANFGQGSR